MKLQRDYYLAIQLKEETVIAIKRKEILNPLLSFFSHKTEHPLCNPTASDNQGEGKKN
jgi:hypothetical protein